MAISGKADAGNTLPTDARDINKIKVKSVITLLKKWNKDSGQWTFSQAKKLINDMLNFKEMNFADYLNTRMDPNRNNFQLFDVTSFQSHNFKGNTTREAWSDGKFLMLNPRWVKENLI